MQKDLSHQAPQPAEIFLGLRFASKDFIEVSDDYRLFRHFLCVPKSNRFDAAVRQITPRRVVYI